MANRLLELCEAAARGRFPAPAWEVEFIPSPIRLAGAVIAFTGHHVVAADVDEVEVAQHLNPDDIAAPFNPAFLAWLGARLGVRAGHIDVTMARMGTGVDDGWLQLDPTPPDNERVRRALSQRADVQLLSPPNGGSVVTLGSGLAGRREISMEISDESQRSSGFGTRLVLAAVGRVPADEAIFASVSPGNVRSLRCLLRAGFVPFGAECLFSRLDEPPR